MYIRLIDYTLCENEYLLRLNDQQKVYFKKMINFGIAASSHSGLIPLKTAYKKRGEVLRALASKKNFINLHSAAFDNSFWT